MPKTKRKKTIKHVMKKASEQTNKKNNEEILNKIKFLYKKCNYTSVLELIDDYLKIDPNNMYVQTYKAMTLFKMYRNEEAIELFEKILNTNLISKRNRLFAMSQYADLLSCTNCDLAIHYFEEVLKESVSLELIARGKLSSLYMKKEQWDKALSVLEIDNFNNMFLNVKRAKVYNKQGKYYKTLSELEREEYNNLDIYVRENLDEKIIQQEKDYAKGHAYYKLDRFDDALKCLTNAVVLRNKNVYVQINIDIIKIYIQKLQLEDAIKLCEEVKKYCNSDYYVNVIEELQAKAYLRKNDYTKAEEKLSGLDTTSEERNFHLGKLELIRGNFEKAEEYLSIVYTNGYDIKLKYDEYYKLALAKFRLKKYDEVEKILDIFEKNYDKYEIYQMKYEMDRLRLYIDISKGKVDVVADTYSKKQMLNYDKQEAINHVKDHHYYNVRTSKFSDEIDIDKFFDEIKEKMNKENLIYDSVFDKYIIKYPNIGVNTDNENIHQLAVLALTDTKDIITMYPCDGSESIFVLEELEEKPKSKVKRLSQIEKFNKKYGNN